MGILYVNEDGVLILHSRIIIYGEAATEELAHRIADDIMGYWNGPRAFVSGYPLWFDMVGIYEPNLTPEDVHTNEDPANNYFRIEEFSNLDVSFVDGINSNTGYFKLKNLDHTGTTVAHEFGHSLGLDHPARLDIRGQGVPGIMYPRGTVVDTEFQYNPAANAGDGPMGGTMDAARRIVTDEDIRNLRLERFKISPGSRHVVGDFSSVYHLAHG